MKKLAYKRNAGDFTESSCRYTNLEDVTLLNKLGYQINPNQYLFLDRGDQQEDVYSYVEKVAGVSKEVSKAIDKGESFSAEYLKELDYDVPKGYELKGDLCYPVEKTEQSFQQKEAEADPNQTILITGHSGSGKSTLGKLLAEKLNLPLHRVDAQESWDDLRANLEANPELESKSYTHGTPENKQYLKNISKIVRKSLNEINGPAILEGTQVTTLPKKQLQNYMANILVGGDVEQSIAQRLQRMKDKAAKKGVVFTPEELARKMTESQTVVDSWNPGIEKFKHLPGVLRYNHTEHDPKLLITQLRKMLNKQATALQKKAFTIVDEPENILAAGGKLVSDTYGRIASLPESLIFGQEKFLTHLKGADKDLIEKSLEKNKDDERLKDVVVRLNHFDPVADVKRLLANKGIVSKTFGALALPMAWTQQLVGRSNNYNPTTNTIHLYSGIPEIAHHELGHAKDFNKTKNTTEERMIANFIEAKILEKVAPKLTAGPLTQVYETNANTEAEKTYGGDMNEFRRRLWPARASYIGMGLSGLALSIPGIREKYIKAALKVLPKIKPTDSKMLIKLKELANSSLPIIGASALGGRLAAEAVNLYKSYQKPDTPQLEEKQAAAKYTGGKMEKEAATQWKKRLREGRLGYNNFKRIADSAFTGQHNPADDTNLSSLFFKARQSKGGLLSRSNPFNFFELINRVVGKQSSASDLLGNISKGLGSGKYDPKNPNVPLPGRTLYNNYHDFIKRPRNIPDLDDLEMMEDLLPSVFMEATPRLKKTLDDRYNYLKEKAQPIHLRRHGANYNPDKITASGVDFNKDQIKKMNLSEYTDAVKRDEMPGAYAFLPLNYVNAPLGIGHSSARHEFAHIFEDRMNPAQKMQIIRRMHETVKRHPELRKALLSTENENYEGAPVDELLREAAAQVIAGRGGSRSAKRFNRAYYNYAQASPEDSKLRQMLPRIQELDPSGLDTSIITQLAKNYDVSL